MVKLVLLSEPTESTKLLESRERESEREGITEISHTMEGNFFCLISQSQIHIGVLGFHFLIDLCRLAAKNFFLLKFVGFAGFFVGWVVGVFVARCTE